MTTTAEKLSAARCLHLRNVAHQLPMRRRSIAFDSMLAPAFVTTQPIDTRRNVEIVNAVSARAGQIH
jgi:hypothetical protein